MEDESLIYKVIRIFMLRRDFSKNFIYTMQNNSYIKIVKNNKNNAKKTKRSYIMTSVYYHIVIVKI
jgi:hypothetical protein